MLPLAGETKISYSKFGICDDRLDLLSGAARSRTPVVQFVCVFEFICSYFGRSTRNWSLLCNGRPLYLYTRTLLCQLSLL